MICEEAEICAVGDFDITIYNMDAKAKMGGCIPHTEAHCSGPTGCLYIEAEAKKSFSIFTAKQPCQVSLQSYRFSNINIFSVNRFKVRW